MTIDEEQATQNEPRTANHEQLTLDITADEIEHMPPDYPPLFTVTDTAASEGQTRSIRATQLDILVVLAGAVISVVVSFVTGEPFHQILSTAAVVAFVLTWGEKTIMPRLRFSQDWFQSRAIAESTKSVMWRYMTRARPFDGDDADSQFLTALRETLHSLNVTLEHAPSRVDGRQITPYMRLVRSLPAAGRKQIYLRLRLVDQLRYYSSKAERGRRVGRRWRISGLVFRAATFGFAAARFWDDNAGLLIGLFVNLTVVVASWSQLMKHEDLAKGY